jgi:hypothetical protein
MHERQDVDRRVRDVSCDHKDDEMRKPPERVCAANVVRVAEDREARRRLHDVVHTLAHLGEELTAEAWLRLPRTGLRPLRAPAPPPARCRAWSSIAKLGLDPVEDLVCGTTLRLALSDSRGSASDLLIPGTGQLFDRLLRRDRVDHDASLFLGELSRKLDHLMNGGHDRSMPWPGGVVEHGRRRLPSLLTSLMSLMSVGSIAFGHEEHRDVARRQEHEQLDVFVLGVGAEDDLVPAGHGDELGDRQRLGAYLRCARRILSRRSAAEHSDEQYRCPRQREQAGSAAAGR